MFIKNQFIEVTQMTWTPEQRHFFCRWCDGTFDAVLKNFEVICTICQRNIVFKKTKIVPIEPHSFWCMVCNATFGAVLKDEQEISCPACRVNLKPEILKGD